MNVVERSITPEGSAVNHQVIANRSPLSAIKVLMPVWGSRYVRQFLEFCLPTCLRLAIFLRWRGGFRAPLLL